MTDRETLNAIKEITESEMSYRLRIISIEALLAYGEDDEPALNLSPAELRTAKENLELVSRADKLLVKWQGLLDEWKDMHPSINRAVWAESAINIWSRVISDLKGIVR
jgi:hypothetical protein